MLLQLRTMHGGTSVAARRLLQQSAAQGFTPAARFLEAAGDGFEGARQLLGALPADLACLVDDASQVRCCTLTKFNEGEVEELKRAAGGKAAVTAILNKVGAARGVERQQAILAATQLVDEGPQRHAEIRLNTRHVPCVWCGRGDKPTKQCARCMLANFCSRECQKQAWPQHKRACGAAAAAAGSEDA
jgi:hypothetical protein